MADAVTDSLDGRTFVRAGPLTGEVDAETRFVYHQTGEVVWVDYSGSAIVHGHLVGTRRDDVLRFRYVHLNADGESAAGRCETRIEALLDGRLRLCKTWTWETRPGSGTSVLEERTPRA